PFPAIFPAETLATCETLATYHHYTSLQRPLSQVVRQRIANPPSPVRIREGPLSLSHAQAVDGGRPARPWPGHTPAERRWPGSVPQQRRPTRSGRVGPETRPGGGCEPRPAGWGYPRQQGPEVGVGVHAWGHLRRQGKGLTPAYPLARICCTTYGGGH